MARPGAARTIGAGRLGRPRQRFPTQCTLLAQSGLASALHMSAFDPKRTSASISSEASEATIKVLL